jgi:Fic family protein
VPARKNFIVRRLDFLREICENCPVFNPKFKITNQILNNVAKIEAAREIIESAPLVPAYEAKFRQEAIIRTVHHGTHIEGNPLEQKEVADVLEGKKVLAKDRDIQEVLNYREVLKYIDSKKDEALTEKLLLEIHGFTTKKILPKDQSGKYRKVQVKITDSATGKISYMPPTPKQIPDLVRSFLLWLNHDQIGETHPVLKAAIAHYFLVAVHPFVDGNGRASRAFSTLILFKEGYDIKKFFSLEEYFDKDAQRYYLGLQKTSNQSKNILERDLTSWIEYFTEGLVIELSRIREKVQKLSVDLKLKGKLGQIPLNDRQLKLVEYMQEYGQMSNKEWRSLLPMVSDDTVLRDLRYLMKKGLVRKRGSTKSANYVLK